MRFAVLAFILLAQGLSALELKPLVRAELRGGWATSPDGYSCGLAGGQILAVPTLAFSADNLVMPILLATLDAQQRPLEEESRYFSQRGMVLLRPTWQVAPWGVTTRLRAEARHTYAKEAVDDAWGKGLYDNEQYGLGVEVSKPLLGLPVTAGLDAAHQSYPNWRELGAQQTGGKHVATKDGDILRGALTVGAGKGSLLAWEAGVQGMLKGYSDCYVTRDDGTVNTDIKRYDSLLTVDAGAQAVPLPGFKAGLEGQFAWFNSNQSYFDPAFNKYQLNFYDMVCLGVSPSLAWLPQGAPDGHSVTLTYSPLWRLYRAREARRGDGSYTGELQREFEQRLRLDARYRLTPRFALLGQATGLWVRSNQAYEATLRSQYDAYTATLGLEARL